MLRATALSRLVSEVRKLLQDEGTTFTEHRVNEPICCPSRALVPSIECLLGPFANGLPEARPTVLTGMKANTNLTTVPPPYGRFWRYEELVGDKSVL